MRIVETHFSSSALRASRTFKGRPIIGCHLNRSAILRLSCFMRSAEKRHISWMLLSILFSCTMYGNIENPSPNTIPPRFIFLCRVFHLKWTPSCCCCWRQRRRHQRPPFIIDANHEDAWATLVCGARQDGGSTEATGGQQNVANNCPLLIVLYTEVCVCTEWLTIGRIEPMFLASHLFLFFSSLRHPSVWPLDLCLPLKTDLFSRYDSLGWLQTVGSSISQAISWNRLDTSLSWRSSWTVQLTSVRRCHTPFKCLFDRNQVFRNLELSTNCIIYQYF